MHRQPVLLLKAVFVPESPFLPSFFNKYLCNLLSNNCGQLPTNQQEQHLSWCTPLPAAHMLSILQWWLKQSHFTWIFSVRMYIHTKCLRYTPTCEKKENILLDKRLIENQVLLAILQKVRAFCAGSPLLSHQSRQSFCPSCSQWGRCAFNRNNAHRLSLSQPLDTFHQEALFPCWNRTHSEGDNGCKYSSVLNISAVASWTYKLPTKSKIICSESWRHYLFQPKTGHYKTQHNLSVLDRK